MRESGNCCCLCCDSGSPDANEEEALFGLPSTVLLSASSA